MRKTVIFVSLILLCVLMCSCQGEQDTENHSIHGTQNAQSENSSDNGSSDVTPNTPPSQNAPRLSKEFDVVTPFSHGRALVKIKGDDNRFLYIDNEGNVLFELFEDLIACDAKATWTAKTYKSGLMLISDPYGMEWITVCGKDGTLFRAEDYGLSVFSDIAADDGYIIAYGTDKVGILNADLEWIVEPSSDFAKYFPYGYHGTTYYKDHIIYSKVGNVRIDITTGAAEDYRLVDASIFYDDVPENWKAEYDGYYFYINISEVTKEIRLSLDDIQADKIDCEGAKFVNGKAPVVLYENGNHYFSLIDATGALLLEPVLYDGEIAYISISKQYIFVGGKDKKSLSTYDIAGNHIATNDKTTFEHYCSDFVISDDVITFRHFRLAEDGETYIKYYYCYTADFRPLIEE